MGSIDEPGYVDLFLLLVPRVIGIMRVLNVHDDDLV